jgi:propanol-preferring alcohol dehydrogenase
VSLEALGAVVPSAGQSVQVSKVSIPDPGPGEVLIRMEACGICRSDLFVSSLQKLPLEPLTLGHEGIGIIQEVGPGVTDFAIGDRVGITFLASTCGECELCRAGRERFCPKQKNTGYTVQGVLATYAVASAQHLVRVPRALKARDAAPLCCAGWTAYGAVRECNLQSGQSLAIYGFGGLGQLALQYARHRGLRVAVADLTQSKLEQAQAHGAEFTVRGEDGARKLQRQFGGADAVVVFTASADGIDQALRSVKRAGSVVLVGLSTERMSISITDTILKGIRLQGNFLGTRSDLEEVFRLAERGDVKAQTEEHDFAAAPDVMDRLKHNQLRSRAVIVF